MKQLLDIPVLDVFAALSRIPVSVPITVQKGLQYLMFMHAVSEELMCCLNDPNMISLEYICALAKEHGGFVEQSINGADSHSIAMAMLHNSTEGVFFTRLTYLTAKLLED